MFYLLMLFQCSVVQEPVQTHFFAEPVFQLVHPVCCSPRASCSKFWLVHDYAPRRLFMARARRKYVILTSRTVSDASSMKQALLSLCSPHLEHQAASQLSLWMRLMKHEESLSPLNKHVCQAFISVSLPKTESLVWPWKVTTTH